MKKILFTALLLGGCLSAQAQQLPNSDFSNWKTECGTTYCWSASSLNSFTTQEERKRPGVEPESWEGGNLNQKNLATVSKPGLVTKYEENNLTAVKLMNIKPSSLSNLKAPGFISFAHPWVYPSSKSDKADGGVYGSLSFSYKPDAIETRIKRTVSTAENAHIIAYLWNGTFKSKIGEGGNPSKEVDDADRAVMGRITATQSGKLIASVDYEFAQTTNQDWETITIPLKYETGMENEIPTKFNLIFSAADYWTRGNMHENNTLYVDNVKLIYYSTLSALTYNGTNLLPSDEKVNVNGATINIDMSNTLYEAVKGVKYTLKGVGASVLSANYNPDTNIYTIQVAGNDNDANNSNVTTYNIQFMKVVTILNGEDIKTTAGKAQVTMTRGFKQGWNTVCLPFATTATKLGATKVQEFTAGDDKSVTFSEVADGKIAANTPYLVYFPMAKSSAYTDIVDLEESDPKDVAHGAFIFIGNYKSGLNMNGFYGVADIKGVQCLRRGGSTATLPAGCAYFVSTSNNANGLAINFDGQTTGINTIEATDAQTTGAVYNLQGIKVSANGTADLPAGIYIQGGRKVIVK